MARPLLKENAMVAMLDGPAVAALWPTMHEVTEPAPVWDKSPGQGSPLIDANRVRRAIAPFRSAGLGLATCFSAGRKTATKDALAQKPRDLLIALAAMPVRARAAG